MPRIVGRVHEVRAAAGQRVEQVESELGNRVTVQRVLRGDELVDPGPHGRLEAGDLALLTGRRDELLGAPETVGPERVESPILLGAIAGQQCSTPAGTAVVDQAGNTVPMLGHTVTYALSNVVLPLLGPLVVLVTFQLQ